MTASKLLDWHRSWQLNGNTVCCRRCGALQLEADGEAELLHSDDCSSREISKTPWTALKSLVSTEVSV
jgi:hypothetical protein